MIKPKLPWSNTPDTESLKALKKLLDAIERGDYNQAPGKLRQSCMTILKENGEPLTDEEYEVAYELFLKKSQND